MSFIKRISQILTPPPRSGTSPRADMQESRSWTPPEAIRANMLKPLLKVLLSAEPASQDEMKNALSELKNIGAKHGKYVTASEIQNCLRLMPKEDRDGGSYKKSRGYELSADLYQQHILQLVQEIETKNKTLGPSVFGSYCAETIDCLFNTDKPHKAIEAGIQLVDALLHRAVLSWPLKDAYLKLAETAAKTTLEESEQLFGRSAAGSVKAEQRGAHEQLDPRTLSFLRDFEQSVKALCRGISDSQRAGAIAKGDTVALADMHRVKHHLEYLNGLAQMPAAAEYAPFRATMFEELLELRLSVNMTQDIAKIHQEIAVLTERQADQERSLGLLTLARRRYKKAFDHFRAAGQSERARDIRDKVQQGSSVNSNFDSPPPQ